MVESLCKSVKRRLVNYELVKNESLYGRVNKWVSWWFNSIWENELRIGLIGSTKFKNKLKWVTN